MILETLRYADEVSKASGFFRDIGDAAPDPELLDLAQSLIDKKTAPFAADKFKDRYGDALRALVDKKQKAHGRKIVEDKDDGRPSGGNVVDLMAALKKSVGAPDSKTPAVTTAKPAAKAKPAPKKAAARKRA